MLRRLTAVFSFALMLSIRGPVFAASRDEVPLYQPGSVVLLRCDGGNETKFGSIYRSARDIWTIHDPEQPLPTASRAVRSGTRLRVLSTSRYQTHVPSGASYLNIQVLHVEPASAPRSWRGYVDSLDVDPERGPKDPTNICD